MTAKKRDQPHHDLIQQYLPGLILNAILEIIREIGDPYVAKPGLGGMTTYPPMAMTAICIMLGTERVTYSRMAGIPKNNHAMAVKMYGDRTVPQAGQQDKGNLDSYHMLQHRSRG